MAVSNTTSNITILLSILTELRSGRHCAFDIRDGIADGYENSPESRYPGAFGSLTATVDDSIARLEKVIGYMTKDYVSLLSDDDDDNDDEDYDPAVA